MKTTSLKFVNTRTSLTAFENNAHISATESQTKEFGNDVVFGVRNLLQFAAVADMIQYKLCC